MALKIPHFLWSQQNTETSHFQACHRPGPVITASDQARSSLPLHQSSCVQPGPSLFSIMWLVLCFLNLPSPALRTPLVAGHSNPAVGWFASLNNIVTKDDDQIWLVEEGHPMKSFIVFLNYVYMFTDIKLNLMKIIVFLKIIPFTWYCLYFSP